VAAAGSRRATERPAIHADAERRHEEMGWTAVWLTLIDLMDGLSR
jgi:hypothetical protein